MQVQCFLAATGASESLLNKGMTQEKQTGDKHKRQKTRRGRDTCNKEKRRQQEEKGNIGGDKQETIEDTRK